MSFNIIGTGGYVPEKVITNDDLSQMVETNDEWITQRVGIKTRHVCTDETTGYLAAQAAKKAIEAANIEPDTLDLIIASTVSSDSICPTVGGIVQMETGATCPAFDLNSACSGFLFALETAAAYFETGRYKRILVVGAEKISRMVDYTDRNTCVIFGDGAGAAVLEKGDGYIASKLKTIGSDSVISIPSSESLSPFNTMKTGGEYIRMKGQETFKFAVNAMTDDIKDLLNENNLDIKDIAYIVPHQANIRIIRFAAKKLGIDEDRVVCNIEKYGNTSSASVALALDELVRSGKLKKGDLIVMAAFGGGLSSGACIVKW